MLTRDLAVKINFANSRTEKFWLTREAKLHAINVQLDRRKEKYIHTYVPPFSA